MYLFLQKNLTGNNTGNVYMWCNSTHNTLFQGQVLPGTGSNKEKIFKKIQKYQKSKFPNTDKLALHKKKPQ